MQYHVNTTYMLSKGQSVQFSLDIPNAWPPLYNSIIRRRTSTILVFIAELLQYRLFSPVDFNILCDPIAAGLNLTNAYNVGALFHGYKNNSSVCKQGKN